MNHTYPDVQTLGIAKEYLRQAAEDRSTPFWIGVGFVKPHMPHVFPATYLDNVPARDAIAVAKNQAPPTGVAALMDWSSGAGANGPSSSYDESDAAPEAVQQDWKQNYYAAVAFSDDMLGELLDALDVVGSVFISLQKTKTFVCFLFFCSSYSFVSPFFSQHGLAETTIVVMTSDHGWGLGEHNHWVKYTNFETDARVPLLVHHPKAPHTWGVHTKSLVEHVDLYPTFAELAGIPVTRAANESIEGESYALLFAPNAMPATTVWSNAHNASFTQYPRCGETIDRADVPHFNASTRCTSVPKTNFKYMGYSMRTAGWRYTEWAEWDGKTLSPQWTSNLFKRGALVELYDHRDDSLAAGAVGQKTWDDFENENVASRSVISFLHVLFCLCVSSLISFVCIFSRTSRAATRTSSSRSPHASARSTTRRARGEARRIARQQCRVRASTVRSSY